MGDSDSCLELALQWQKDTGASADATIIAAAIMFGIGAMVGLNVAEKLQNIANDLPTDDLNVTLHGG